MKIDRIFLEELIKQQTNENNSFPWELYDSISVAENKELLENIVLEKSKELEPKNNFENRYYLNLIYCLGKIGDETTSQILTEVLKANKEYEDLVLEILDALGNIFKKIEPTETKIILNILNQIALIHKNQEITSSISYVLEGINKNYNM
jgi:hypothetical protein